MNSINKIIKESGIFFTGSTIGNLLGYLWLILITRYLSQDEFGSFTLAQSIINVLMIIVLLGTHRSLDRYIPIYNQSGETGKTKHLLLSIIRLSLVTSIIIGIVLIAASAFIGTRIFPNPDLIRILPITALSIPSLAIILVVVSAFTGFKELRYYVYLREFLEPALKILFAIIIGVLGLGLVEWSWLYILSMGMVAGLGVWFLYQQILLPLKSVESIPIDFSEIFSYSWPISLASIVMILVGQIDYLVLGIYHPASNVGIYRIFIQIVTLMKLILGSIARIYKPTVSELIPENRLDEIRDIYRRVSKWVLLMTTLGTLVIVIYGDRLTGILFTTAYSGYPLTLSILAVGTFLNSAFGPEGMTLEAFGRTKLVMLNSLVILGINLGLDFALIPQYGISGAAVSTALSLAVGGMLGFLQINYLYQMQPFSIQTLKFLSVGLITGVVFYLVEQALSTDSIIVLLLSIMLMSGFYILGVLTTKSLDKVDLDILNRILVKIRPGK